MKFFESVNSLAAFTGCIFGIFIFGMPAISRHFDQKTEAIKCRIKRNCINGKCKRVIVIPATGKNEKSMLNGMLNKNATLRFFITQQMYSLPIEVGSSVKKSDSGFYLAMSTRGFAALLTSKQSAKKEITIQANQKISKVNIDTSQGRYRCHIN